MFAITLAGGAWIFAAFIVLYGIAVVYSLYTRTGSGINQRSYADPYGDSPGAGAPSTLTHDDSAARRYTRGTR